jgi:methionyl aminopeptidase
MLRLCLSPSGGEPLDVLVAELRAIGTKRPTTERRAILRAALLHKREGVQSVAAQVLGGWGGRESVEDLRLWLGQLERHDPYIGPRTIAIRELERCIDVDDSDWVLDLYSGQEGVVATHEYFPLASATDPVRARPRIERERDLSRLVYFVEMSVKSERDLVGLRAAGRVVAEALAAMRDAVRPGVTTGDVDEVGAAVFARHGARSAPQLAYGFPGVNCISVNSEAVHGVPSGRSISDGDLVKLDVTAELNGYMADAAITVGVGTVTRQARELVETAERALARALRVARAGVLLNEIGRAVQREVENAGFHILPQLGGHGIGRTIHEPPSVPNHYVASDRTVLTEGLVITIEPIISATTTRSVGPGADGWTISTADQGLSAHAEHTLVVTTGEPLILTAA